MQLYDADVRERLVRKVGPQEPNIDVYSLSEALGAIDKEPYLRAYFQTNHSLRIAEAPITQGLGEGGKKVLSVGRAGFHICYYDRSNKLFASSMMSPPAEEVHREFQLDDRTFVALLNCALRESLEGRVESSEQP